MIGALSIGDGAASRWAVLACAALVIVIGVVALLRSAAAGPGARTTLERVWTVLPLALVALLLALSALAIP